MTAIGSLQLRDATVQLHAATVQLHAATVQLHDANVTPRLCHKAAVRQQKELE